MAVIINGSSGITNVNGSAAAPAETGTDTDTGVYSPTSNQVALAAGGTMALVATSSQQVGVAAVPSSEWTGQDLFQVSSSSIYSTLSLATYRTVTTGNRIGSLVFEMPNNTANYRTRAEIACEMTGSTANKFGGTIRLNIAGDNVVSNSMTNSAVFNQYGMGLNATPSSGTGITFPASQSASSNANTLDDYEEGTFTPVFKIGGTTNVTGAGNYVKIGAAVYWNIVFYNDTWTRSGTGNLEITGMPFTSASSTPLNGAGSGGGNYSGYKFILPNNTWPNIGAAQTTMTIYGGGGPQTQASIASSGFFFEQLSGWYYAS